MIFERWALFKAVGLVPKTIQAAARTDIASASCEVCSNHLGLELLDLLPPFKDVSICDVCNCIYHWHCYYKPTAIMSMSERLLTPMTHGPAQPVLT
jgi:hypothetical protein